MPLHGVDLLKACLGRVGLREPLAFVRMAMTRPQTIADEMEFLKDYLAFRKVASRLAGGAERTDPSKKVLIISLTSWLAQVKTLAMLAKAMQLEGCTPVILTRRTHRRALKYYRVLGLRDLRFFEDFWPLQVPSDVAQQIDHLLAGRCTIEEVKAFRYRAVRVGRQALATCLRRRHSGRIDMADPKVLAYLAELLREGVQAVDAAEAMLAEVDPKLALVCDPIYVGVGAVFESAVARGIPVIQWVVSQRDDAFAFKRYTPSTMDMHPFSLSEDTWWRAQEEPWTASQEAALLQDFRDRYVEGKWDSYYNRPYGQCLAREDLHRRLGLNPQKQTAVIFPHILWDPTMFWGEDLFENYEAWLIETVRAACRNPAVNWIVRFHPANVWKLKVERLHGTPLEQRVLEAACGTLPPHVTFLKPEHEVNTFTLFQAADYGVTVRGTIGIELAAFGVPVLTAGTGRYSGRGFTLDSTSRADYLAKLERIQDLPRLTPQQTELAKKYAHALFIRRPTKFSTFRVVFRSVREAAHPICNNVQISARSSRDLAEAEDLRQFAAWALHSDQIDFLTPVGGAQHAAVPTLV